MSDDVNDLEKINEVYREFAQTTLPKGKGWVLFLVLGLGIPGMTLAIIHRVLDLPLLHKFEPDVARTLIHLVLAIFLMGLIFQGRSKPIPTSQLGAPDRYRLFKPSIQLLIPFPETSLETFLDMQKALWEEAEKEAETSAATAAVFGTILATLADWSSQSKAPFVMGLLLLAATYFALSHTQYRIAKLRHFEFMVQQAIKLKGKIPVPVPAHADSEITLGAVA